MIREIGILMRRAARPPINPPSTQEFKVLAKIRTTTDAANTTNARIAILMKIESFLRDHHK